MYKNFLQGFANPNLLVMFFLGISCGFPLVLTASTLKLWATDLGLSITGIAAFAWIAIPYSIKFLWAPFVDGIKIPYLHKSLGHRRSWLLLVQSALLLAILLLATCIAKQNVLYCCIVAVLIAFLSATQDIIVDAYRIGRLPKDLQASGVTMYVYGYRIGLYAAGAGMLFLAHNWGWPTAYYIGALVIAVGIITTLFCAESNYVEKIVTNKKLSFIENFIMTVVSPFKEFLKIHEWYYLILFVVLFKLGDAVAGNLTLTFLKKKGFTLEELALYVKTYSLIAAVIGAFLGSIIFKRYNLLTSLLFAGTVQMLSNLVFVYQDYMGHDLTALTLTIFTEGISGAVGDVIFVGYISTLCNLQFAATQYALLSALATVGRNAISGFSGFIVDSYGWTVFFIVSTVLALPGILLIFKVVNIKRKP